MNNRFRLHEMCNNDVNRLVTKFRNLKVVDVRRFELELIFAYQLIYENPNVGSLYTSGDHGFPHYRESLKYYELPHFDCYIIYKHIPPNNIIVLGLFSRKRNWRI